MSTTAFASVILDVDSTLCGIEGVDWLANRRDPALAAELAKLTIAAMAGEITLESIYTGRLERIRPDAQAVAELAEAYRESVAPGAQRAIERLRSAGIQVELVSGGLRRAILPMSHDLGFQPAEVHAVEITFDGMGDFLDFDRASPLATATGKCEVVKSLGLPTPIIAVGDGMSDAALRAVTDAFAVFTGFVRRDTVVALADHDCRSFDDLLKLVLP